MVKGATADEIEIAKTGGFLSLDPAFCQVKEAIRVIASGNKIKTAASVERVAELLAAGCAPADIRVICATSAVCDDYKKRLRAKLGDNAAAADEVDVTTTRALSLEVLAAPEAQAAVGRTFSNGQPRIASAFELDFILEDIKMLHNQPERLRELVKFLLRGLSLLADEGKSWLITLEEKETLAFLQAEFKFLQILVEPEVANLASKALRRSEALGAAYKKKHVIVHDYQLLSRASQLLCHLLASDSIMVLADHELRTEVFDSYPNEDGVGEFVDINPNAELRELESLPPAKVVDIWDWKWNVDEFAGAPGRIKAALDEGIAPEDAAVVSFNPLWYNRVMCGLNSRGVPVRGLYEPLTLKGDIRRVSRSLPLMIVTALRLLANPADSMACRCWIGFGDRTTMNKSFVHARVEAQEANPDAVFADVVSHREGWAESTAFITECADKTGIDLLNHLAETFTSTPITTIPPVLAPLLGLGKEATAADMLAFLDQRQFFPKFATTEGVTFVSLETLACLDFEHIFVVGFVNGMFPHRYYFDLVEATAANMKKIVDTEDRRFGLLTTAATGDYCLSYFSQADEILANKLQLKADRIIMNEKMERIYYVSLSALAEKLK